MKGFLYALLLVIARAYVEGQTFGSYLANYAPLLDGPPWKQPVLVEYREGTPDLWFHPTSSNSFPTVHMVLEDDADFSTVILSCPDGRTFKTYCDARPSPFGVEVYSADLNSDGAPDFMIVKPGSGCGLAAEYCTGVFAFSERQSYRFTRIRTMGLGTHSLVVDPKSKDFRLIHTSFRSGMSSDGRYHSYWVQRFFEWDGQNFREDSNLAPVWIQFLHRPNHEPTKLLTSKLKSEAWNEDAEPEAKIEW